MTRAKSVRIIHEVKLQEYTIPGLDDVIYAHEARANFEDDERALEAATAVHGLKANLHIVRRYSLPKLGPCNQDMLPEKD